MKNVKVLHISLLLPQARGFWVVLFLSLGYLYCVGMFCLVGFCLVGFDMSFLQGLSLAVAIDILTAKIG